MTKQRRYDDEFKRTAVRMVLEDGLSQRAVERNLGLTHGLLKVWVRKARAQQPAAGGGTAAAQEVDVDKLLVENECLRRDNAIKKASSGQLLDRPNHVFGFIARHRSMFGVQEMCRVLQVSRSGYYAWLKAQSSPRRQAAAELAAQVIDLHRASDGTYGVRRIYHELRARGVQIGRDRVWRVMQRAGLRARAAAEVHRHDRQQPSTSDGTESAPAATQRSGAEPHLDG
jgi:putative transposase